MNEDFIKYNSKMDRPIPGESLTNDPENPYPWEKPTEFTNVVKASEYLFEILTEEETYVTMMTAIEDGTPVMDIAQVFLFQGFNQGKWNPDLMLLLIEPATYILMALAERAGIDYKLYTDEEKEDEAEAELLGVNIAQEKFSKIKQAKGSMKVPEGILPASIEEKIEELPQPKSLLEKV